LACRCTQRGGEKKGGVDEEEGKKEGGETGEKKGKSRRPQLMGGRERKGVKCLS